jgi:8-oxo-dGTP pyrophosphatase MutT (NUDIX family)
MCRLKIRKGLSMQRLKPSVGVVIGRFQCHRLHEGHKELLSKAEECSKLLVCVGVSKVLGTPRDPLDYPARERMIKESYPRATVVPLPDQPTNEEWSKHLNQLIKIMFPTDEVVIYCGRSDGRSSVQDGYNGPYKLVEIGAVSTVSGTDLRFEVGRSVEASQAFRKGVIYGATNQFARIDPVVDICVWRRSEKGKIQILLGKRNNEGGYRLPGGHIEVNDKTAKEAAIRELIEETGLEAVQWSILDHVRISSRSTFGYAMFSTLFLAEYTFGKAEGNDDLDNCIWIDLDRIDQYQYVDDHFKLVKIAYSTLEKI